MMGCIKAMQHHAGENPELVDSKHLRIAADIEKLIVEFPSDPQDPALQDKLGHVRSRFKVLTAGVSMLQGGDKGGTETLEF